MKRKEDLKKRWKEEIQDLKTGTKFHKFLFPIIIFFYQDASSQIYINGFCKYEDLVVDTGFSKIYSLNINGDPYTDLLLYSPQQNNFNLLVGGKELFAKPIKNEITFPISSLENFFTKKNINDGYIFISRSKKRTGFVRLNKSGKIQRLLTVQLKSAPDKLLTDDFDNDGTAEALLAGISYSGLTLIREKRGTFKQDDFASHNSYSEITSLFINNDEFLDFAAFDPLKNEFHFYYNNGNGNFSLSRKIDVVRNVSKLNSFDFNLDGFTDLIFEQSQNIIVLLGDADGSFSKQLKIITKFNPDKYIYGDFNRDGLIDIAYLNLNTSSIFVLFQSDENIFSAEFLILKKKSLTDLIPFYSRFIDGILSLSSEGKLYLVSRLTRFGDETKTIFASENPKLAFYDYTKNNTADIIFHDDQNRKLKFIIRNDAGIPAVYYETSTLEKYNKMVIDDDHPLMKKIYLYNRDKKTIQVIEANLQQYRVKRSFIYTDGSISDLKLNGNNPTPGTLLSVKINKRQFIANYQVIEGKYTRTQLKQIDENVTRFFFTESEKIFYWKELDQESALYFRENISSAPIKLYSYNSSSTKMIFSDYLQGNVSNSVYSYFLSEELKYLLVRNENAQNIIRDFLADEIENDKKFVFKSISTFSGSVNKIYLYLPHQKALYDYQLRNRLNKITTNKIAEFQTESDFSIQRMTTKDNFVLYFNQADKHLTLAKLK